MKSNLFQQLASFSHCFWSLFALSHAGLTVWTGFRLPAAWTWWEASQRGQQCVGVATSPWAVSLDDLVDLVRDTPRAQKVRAQWGKRQPIHLCTIYYTCPWMLYIGIYNRQKQTESFRFMNYSPSLWNRQFTWCLIKKNQYEKFLFLSAFRRDTILFVFSFFSSHANKQLLKLAGWISRGSKIKRLQRLTRFDPISKWGSVRLNKRVFIFGLTATGGGCGRCSCDNLQLDDPRPRFPPSLAAACTGPATAAFNCGRVSKCITFHIITKK